MIDSDWQPLAIIIDPADPHWERRLAAALPTGVSFDKRTVVSFCDAAVGICPADDWPPASHWRDLVPASLLESLWRDSYADIKELLRALPSDSRCWLDCYLHVLADALTRCRALDYLAEAVRPELIILPSGSELACRFSKPRHAQSLITRLWGGSRNTRHIRRWFGRQRELPDSKNAPATMAGAALSGILMVVEDGVSAVHRDPALAIAGELSRLHFSPRILTSNPGIAAIFSTLGHTVQEVQPRSFLGFAFVLATQSAAPWYKLKNSLRISSRATQAVGPYFMAWLKSRVTGFIARRLLLLEGLEQMAKERPVEVILSLGETFPLVITALTWAKYCGIPDVAFTPVLIGNRPDNEDFPASRHLVYGDQGAECMVNHKVPREAIEVVGSPTHGNALGRDREADSRAIRKLLPAWRLGQQLLVVATEALSNPEKELIPILRASTSLENLHTVIKVHPADSRAGIDAIVSELGLTERVDVLLTCDVAALLHSADLLVCVLSNIAVTAAILGTPTMVPTFTCRSRPVDFVDEGFASACDDITRLPMLIRELTTPGIVREVALERMRRTMRKFTGPADGNSRTRVAEAVIRLLPHNQ